ncbi:MAG: sialate O-acetylesterase [Gemmiger sp.]|nr:sialate O-acetylesterase [Gemmiger sp.]
MHGITLTSAPADWAILQQQAGFAEVTLRGSYCVHPAAIEVGVAQVCPMVRVMREDSNLCVLPWQPLAHHTNPDFSGTFADTLRLPAGGLYRIDTTLETKSVVKNLTWLYRGDCVLHLGVGDVFIIAGQSNAAGYSRDYAPDPPSMAVHLYRNRGCWDIATHPMNESTGAGSLPNEEMGIPGVSPYLSFAKRFSQMSGRPVGLVQTALGGSPISRWLPAGDLYGNMMQKVTETQGQFAGVLWYQGCNDTAMELAPHYLQNFTTLVNAMRQALGYTVPFFTFQLNRMVGDPNHEGWALVREAQRQAADQLEKVYLLPTTNCALADAIHNSAAANLVLGEKLAMQAGHYLLGGPLFEAPRLARATLTAPRTLRLEYDHVAVSFIVRSVDNADNGFTLEDDDGPLPIEAVSYGREDRNGINLLVGRAPVGSLLLSFQWTANPVSYPPVDEVTCLPPLSCYKLPLTLR